MRFLSKLLPTCCFRKLALRLGQQCSLENLASPNGSRPASPPPYTPPVSSLNILGLGPQACPRPGLSSIQSAPASVPHLGTEAVELSRNPSEISLSSNEHTKAVSALHPQVAVILGVPKFWHVFLQLARAASMSYSIWCGIWCLTTFFEMAFILGTDPLKLELRYYNNGWDLEKRLQATCILAAGLWCAASAYLSFFFTDCLMSRWLLNYTPFATLLRLGMTDFLLAYVPKLALARLGAFNVPSRLLPAWIVITFTVAIAYHLTHDHTNIKRETEATKKVLFAAMAVTLFAILLQHHFPLSAEL